MDQKKEREENMSLGTENKIPSCPSEGILKQTWTCGAGVALGTGQHGGVVNVL